jgi:AcrR family transcriptional regulator
MVAPWVLCNIDRCILYYVQSTTYNAGEVFPIPSARTGAGDPARTLRLLWRDPAVVPRHGPRQGLTVDRIVASATALADADGLDAVTMRRLAGDLGVVPMTLYTYVPGKAELLDLLLDAAYQRMPRTDTTGQPWRQRITAIAAENRALFEAHPWAAAITTGRPPLGPGLMVKYEHELAALDGLGLDDIQMDAALTHLLAFVQAWARAATDFQATRQDTAMDEEQWWAASGPLLQRVLDPGAYPLAARVGTAAGTAHRGAYDPQRAYDFGLRTILDGLAALIGPPR